MYSILLSFEYFNLLILFFYTFAFVFSFASREAKFCPLTLTDGKDIADQYYIQESKMGCTDLLASGMRRGC